MSGQTIYSDEKRQSINYYYVFFSLFFSVSFWFLGGTFFERLLVLFEKQIMLCAYYRLFNFLTQTTVSTPHTGRHFFRVALQC